MCQMIGSSFFLFPVQFSCSLWFEMFPLVSLSIFFLLIKQAEGYRLASFLLHSDSPMLHNLVQRESSISHTHTRLWVKSVARKRVSVASKVMEIYTCTQRTECNGHLMLNAAGCHYPCISSAWVGQ